MTAQMTKIGQEVIGPTVVSIFRNAVSHYGQYNSGKFSMLGDEGIEANRFWR